ncbi:von Willebrand factor D and EGF domain-containing protein-like [Hyposmocoma kahamanoa]|uniref:von Willebrand factor D and EGF domain-containing protein-like n=1 Tax=Hyposmocoma kahamanoa TaxID=1477025 RepID=UPI000E6D736B|nr:von Willebrand factor D and EGF domain-containing protein-like [Hyposmocoma kahamanoa]
MMRVLICVALIACAYAYDYDDDVQQVQQSSLSLKGGHGDFEYLSSANLEYILGNRTQKSHFGNSTHGFRQNMTLVQNQAKLEIGVCYIEVPTATLVRDGKAQAGNGSQPHLSRIRSCCRGYIRNIHNFYKCDPVCTQECVNALCTAPDTCTCFPDHVKNLAGFCTPTCPIGCQNGQCSGGECLCKQGYKLDLQSGRFCIPACQENCGGIGNCTAPNTCDCKTGYKSSPEGSCKPVCDRCTNGDCVAPGECRCHQGFAKDQQGICTPRCEFGYHSTPNGCKPICNSCTNGECVGPNECRCNQGYARDYQGQCIPQCYPSCGPASRCVSPNVCDPPVRPQPRQPYQPDQTFYQPTQPHNLYPLLPQNLNGTDPLPQGVPQCAQPCLNGFCIGNNKCSCNAGYVPDQSDPSGFMCIPSCPGGCPNGVCSAPNFCICNIGYIKDRSVKGRAVCIRREKRSLNVAELLVYMIPDNAY